jgi:hypothetical protein
MEHEGQRPSGAHDGKGRRTYKDADDEHCIHATSYRQIRPEL